VNECKPLAAGGGDGAGGLFGSVAGALQLKQPPGRGLHSFISQLNLSRFSYTSPCPPV